MLHSIKFYEQTFKAQERKNAYLKACKWLASNVLSKAEIGDILFNIEEDKESSSPAFKLELYCSIDEKDSVNDFCNTCKKFHKSFFINESYNCDRCNMKTFEARMKEKLIVKQAYRAERLRFILNKK